MSGRDCFVCHRVWALTSAFDRKPSDRIPVPYIRVPINLTVVDVGDNCPDSSAVKSGVNFFRCYTEAAPKLSHPTRITREHFPHRGRFVGF